MEVPEDTQPLFNPRKKGVEDKIEVQMLWETCATSTECFGTLYRDIPVDLPVYSKDNNLLEEVGWKKLKRLESRSKLIERLAKQAKLQSFRISPRYKYGFEVPKNFKDAQKID